MSLDSFDIQPLDNVVMSLDIDIVPSLDTTLKDHF